MHRLALRHPLAFLPVIGRRFEFADYPIGGSTRLADEDGAPGDRSSGIAPATAPTPGTSPTCRTWTATGSCCSAARTAGSTARPSSTRFRCGCEGRYIEMPLRLETVRDAVPLRHGAAAVSDRRRRSDGEHAPSARRTAIAALRLHAAAAGLRPLPARASCSGRIAVEAQRRQLRKLLAKAKDTRFGRDHGFAGDRRRSPTTRRRCRCAATRRCGQEYWQPSFPRLDRLHLARHHPLLRADLRDHHRRHQVHPLLAGDDPRRNRRATLDLLTHHLANRPESTLFAGRNFMLGGSTRADGAGARHLERRPERHRRHAPCRSGRGRSTSRRASWRRSPTGRRRSRAGAGLARRGHPRHRRHAELAAAVPREAGGAATARPGAGWRPSTPNSSCWCTAASTSRPTARIFAEWLEGSRAETREVYPASEGFIAVADRGDGEGLRMIVDNGLFYEFVPVEELDAADADPPLARRTSRPASTTPWC